MRLPPAVLFDLDSTLADTSHRRDLVPERRFGDQTSAWEEYSAACTGDALVEASAVLLDVLPYPAVILTGRNESARPQTEEWLARHAVSYAELVMRPPEANGLSSWKRKAIAELQGRWRFLLAVDDWPPGARVSEKLGIPTVVVANAWNPDAVSHLLGELRA